MKTPYVVGLVVVSLIVGFMLGAHHARRDAGRYFYGTCSGLPCRTNRLTGASDVSAGGSWKPLDQQPVVLQH